MVNKPSNKKSGSASKDQATTSAQKSAESSVSSQSGYIPVSASSTLSASGGITNNNSIQDILNALQGINTRLQNLELIQVQPPSLVPADTLSDDSSEESSEKDFTGKHWGLETLEDIRKTFNITDSVPDVEVLSVLSAKTLKHYSSHEVLLNRVQHLMTRYKNVVEEGSNYPKLREIQSKSLQKVMELLSASFSNLWS